MRSSLAHAVFLPDWTLEGQQKPADDCLCCSHLLNVLYICYVRRVSQCTRVHMSQLVNEESLRTAVVNIGAPFQKAVQPVHVRYETHSMFDIKCCLQFGETGPVFY